MSTGAWILMVTWLSAATAPGAVAQDPGAKAAAAAIIGAINAGNTAGVMAYFDERVGVKLGIPNGGAESKYANVEKKVRGWLEDGGAGGANKWVADPPAAPRPGDDPTTVRFTAKRGQQVLSVTVQKSDGRWVMSRLEAR